MKKALFLVLFFPLIFVISRTEGAAPNLSLSLTTDKPSYTATEPIAMALTVLNVSSTVSKVTFSSSCVYDFVIYNDDQPVWKWSTGKMFAQMVTTVEYSPKKPRTYLYVFNPNTEDATRLAPGKYKLVGSLRTINKTYLSEPIWVEIRK